MLLTCYTKLKDEPKLKELLDGLAAQKTVATKTDFHKTAVSDAAAAAAAGQSVVFDPQQAITTLNAAGYSDYALKIAAKYRIHAAYLSIQVMSDLSVSCCVFYHICIMFLKRMRFMCNSKLQ